MNKEQINEVMTKVRKGEKVSYNDLRKVVKAKGITLDTNTPNTEQLIAALSVKRGPGRPKADPSQIIGYKVKIGLRYPNANGELVTSMKEAHTFPTEAEGQKMVDKLVADGQVRVWGDSVRAKFLPRYGSAS